MDSCLLFKFSMLFLYLKQTKDVKITAGREEIMAMKGKIAR
jgi:hypothetical protein